MQLVSALGIKDALDVSEKLYAKAGIFFLRTEPDQCDARSPQLVSASHISNSQQRLAVVLLPIG
jgi:hypothetical protein